MGKKKSNTLAASDPTNEGKKWERYVNELLSIHYSKLGHVYQEVPDGTQGDGGLEGWVDATGEAFQAYSGALSDTAAKLTANQTKKITDTVDSLNQYKTFWQGIFQPRSVRLHRLTLVVPKTVNKKVLTHATESALSLRNKSLPFIAPDFMVYVCTHNSYPDARACIRTPELAHAIELRNPNLTQLRDPEPRKPDFQGQMEQKLRKLMPPTVSDSKVREQQAMHCRDHLRCQNYFADLRDRFPSFRDQLDEFLAIKADETKTSELLDDDKPRTRLRRVKENLKGGVADVATFANDAQQLAVVEGTIAYWLGECSLDFAS